MSILKTAHEIRTLASEGYDCIHAHTRGMATLARQITSLPLVTTVHLDFKVGPIRRLLAELGEHTLAVSEDLCDYLTREYRARREDITVTVNGIDPSCFSFCEGTPFQIAHASRFDRDRSRTAKILCEIAPKLCERFPTAEIVLCGSGNDEKCIQFLANEANSTIGRNAVRYLGGCANVAPVLQSASIFVGVSRAALESMGAGCAVILSGNDGYGGILTKENFFHHARTNFCARGEDAAKPDRLLIDLITLCNSPTLTHSLASMGRSMIEQRYTPERMANDALDAYQKAIGQRRRRTTLVGYYGYGNLGDEATRTVLEHLLLEEDLQILVHGTPKQKNEKNRFTHPFSAIRNSGTVVFGGGNLFQNTTTDRSLFYYSTLLRYAHGRGCRTVLLGGGIGDFKSANAREKMRALLPLFDRILCRTCYDVSLARELGARTASLLPDPCFLLPEQKKPRTKAEQSVLICPRGAQMHGRERLFSELRDAGYSLLFIPLSLREDMKVCKSLAYKFGGELLTCLRVEDLCTALSRVDFCICERLHGSIFSLLCHTPCFLLTDRSKSRALCDDAANFSEAHGLRSPILPFAYYGALSGEKIKRETEGVPFGFSELLKYVRSFYGSLRVRD